MRCPDRQRSPRLRILLSVVVLLLAAGSTLSRISRASALTGNRIPWQGANLYLHGANVPWYNWSCDFGCGADGGVSSPAVEQALAPRFTSAQAAGMHVLRWWMFEGGARQIETDSTGTPIGVNPAVYPDIDAALQLASQYGFSYDFVLFSGAGDSALPTSWETDPTQRSALAQVLGQLFAHYSNSPYILSWEIYNEPEFDILNGKIDLSSVVQTAAAVTDAIHANSSAYATVGTAFADGMRIFNGIGLDYYSPHWYDYMSQGFSCMICNSYATYASMAENKPIVIGEFYSGTSSTTPYSSSYRFNYWYNNGFAGAWAWSLLPGRTSDGLAIDITSAQAFAGQHSDLVPATTRSQAPGALNLHLPLPISRLLRP